MALFKVFRGTEEDLAKVVDLTEGYGYFIPNTFDYIDDDGNEHLGGKLFFDVRDKANKLQRVQVQAQVARGLLVREENGDETYIPADQVARLSDIDHVLHGEDLVGIIVGDGTDDLTAVNITENQILLGAGDKGVKGFGVSNNSLLLGDSTNGLKEIAPSNNALILGDSSNGIRQINVAQGALIVGSTSSGITELSGVGAVFAEVNGEPKFGNLPIGAGGTGGNSAATARNNLGVYSKDETVEEVKKATTAAYEATLHVDDWVANDDASEYSYTLGETRLTCGSTGTVPPIVTYTSNLDEYSKITGAVATPGVGIVFTIAARPANDIGIIVVDNA